MKLKYKNEISDKKLTHTGCVSLNATEVEDDIEKLINQYEEGFEKQRNPENKPKQISKVSIDIDCSSNYVKLAIMTLISFLL